MATHRSTGRTFRRARFSPLAVSAVAILWSAAGAAAQLVPERLYYGRGGEIRMRADAANAREATEVLLFRPGASAPIERAAARGAEIDLAALFPVLWAPPAGEQPRVLYAQLAVDGEPVGPAVVLQPMVSPAQAVAASQMDPRAPSQIEFRRPPQPTYSGIRAYVDRDVVLDTDKGEIRIALRPDTAPNTAFNFRHLVEGGFYDGVIFHRVVPQNPRGGFVVQAGDPTGTGTGGPGYHIDLEPSELRHDFGVISMARSGDPNSGGSQFFLCLSREGTSFLDGSYTAFGQMISGSEVLEAIAAVPIRPPTAEGRDRPVDPPVIRRAYLADASPFPEKPGPARPRGEAPIQR